MSPGVAVWVKRDVCGLYSESGRLEPFRCASMALTLLGAVRLREWQHGDES
jgi:hypothetical protein